MGRLWIAFGYQFYYKSSPDIFGDDWAYLEQCHFLSKHCCGHFFEQLLALPAETVSGAMARLTALVRAGQLPASIIANISNRSFQNFRQLLINTLGKEEALAAVSALVGTTAMHRRAHIVSSALKGGRRHGQKRRATKKRRTIRR